MDTTHFIGFSSLSWGFFKFLSFFSRILLHLKFPSNSQDFTPPQTPTWTIENRNVWDFLSVKKRFWLQNQKFAAKFSIVELKPSSTNDSNLESKDTSTRGGRNGVDESVAEVCYDRGLKLEASLETRVHASFPWGTFCSVAHGRHWACGRFNKCFNNIIFGADNP